MTQQSGTNERFLQTPVILSEIMRTMEPDLAFLPIIPKVDSQGQPVTYGIKGSASADAKKQTPRMMTASAKFPEVTVSRITKASALLNKEGFSIRLDEDALNLPAGADMISDAYSTLGSWIAENVNTNIYTILRAGGTDAGMTPAAEWSSSSSTPMTDLRTFKNAMKVAGKPYRATDMFTGMTCFNELEEFLAGSDIPAYRDAAINGQVQGASSSMVLPMEGKPVMHGLHAGITDGDLLELDAVHKTHSSLFYWNNPKYSSPQITYEVADPMAAGGIARKTVDNFGLSANQYFDDEKHEYVIQVWLDYVVVVKDAYGIRYDDGI